MSLINIFFNTCKSLATRLQNFLKKEKHPNSSSNSWPKNTTGVCRR